MVELRWKSSAASYDIKYKLTIRFGYSTPTYLPEINKKHMSIQRHLHEVHSIFIHNSPTLETAQMPLNRRIG